MASAKAGERFASEMLGSRLYSRRKAERQVGVSFADVCEQRLVARSNVTPGRWLSLRGAAW